MIRTGPFIKFSLAHGDRSVADVLWQCGDLSTGYRTACVSERVKNETLRMTSPHALATASGSLPAPACYRKRFCTTPSLTVGLLPRGAKMRGERRYQRRRSRLTRNNIPR